MPLNVPAVNAASLPNLLAEVIPVIDQSAQNKENLNKATPVTPATIGVGATNMPAVAAAGVTLAKMVLSIVAGVILALMLYLVWMDYSVARDVANAYKQALNPSQTGSEFYTLDRLEQFTSDLNSARANPNQTTSKEMTQRDQDIVKMLAELPSLTITQKAQLNQCAALPTDSTRSEKADQCATIIDNIRKASLGAAASTTNAQIAGEAAGKIQDQRQNLHQFWIQAAQLILLNLLLPLLTALFGYIFGTQQAVNAKANG